jgi:hypothetical protein
LLPNKDCGYGGFRVKISIQTYDIPSLNRYLSQAHNLAWRSSQGESEGTKTCFSFLQELNPSKMSKKNNKATEFGIIR